FQRERNVTVQDQFGSLVVDLIRPVALLVPTAKDLVSTPPPLASSAVDHFKCYRARGARRRISNVKIDDQFRSFNVAIVRPRWLCAPASKEGSLVVDGTSHLMCYDERINGQPFTEPGPLFVNNQFGPDTLRALRPRVLCVPAIKNGGASSCGNGIREGTEQCDPPGSPPCPGNAACNTATCTCPVVGPV